MLANDDNLNYGKWVIWKETSGYIKINVFLNNLNKLKNEKFLISMIVTVFGVKEIIFLKL